MIRRGGELAVVFFRHAPEPTSTLGKIMYVVLRRHTHVAAVLCWRAAESFCALLSTWNSGLVSGTHSSHCGEWAASRCRLATPRPAVRVHARQRGMHRACAAPLASYHQERKKQRSKLSSLYLFLTSIISLSAFCNPSRICEAPRAPKLRAVPLFPLIPLWCCSRCFGLPPPRKAHALTNIFFLPQILTFLQSSSHLVPVLLLFDFSFRPFPPPHPRVIMFQ